MNRSSLRSFSVLWVFALCSVATAQGDPRGNPRVQIVDGSLTVTGPIDNLEGLQVLSSGGFLSLDRFEVPGTNLSFPRTEPFSSATVVSNTPNEISLVASPVTNAVDIDGTIVTSIQYSESHETAFRKGDLTVRLGFEGEAVELSYFCFGRLFCPEPSSRQLMWMSGLAIVALRRPRCKGR